MATSSILYDFILKEKEQIENFIKAIELSSKDKDNEVKKINELTEIEDIIRITKGDI